MPRFDQVIDIISQHLGNAFPKGLPKTVIVRDAIGSATIVLPNDSLPEEKWDSLGQELHDSLGNYSSGPRRVLLRHSDLIDPDDVLSSPDLVQLPEKTNISIIDRLLTNQDWLRLPVVPKLPVPTATAFSIKGGVGRSTAFAVWAWHLARQGKRVLVIDLDLEAPGIGSLLLDDLPDYGLVDWFVEALANQAGGDLLEEMLAPSPLAVDAIGTIQVISAFGTKTRNYVAKLGRVYMPAATLEGPFQGFAHRLGALINQAAARPEPPDAILLDARAGLHEIGAAAVTQLGAEVFLFARNDAQTWDAYARLFDHLRMARTVTWGMPEEDLRWRLKMVAAQLDTSESASERWIDAAYSTWSGFYDAEVEGLGEGAQTFDRADEEAPHHPLPIIFDPRVRGLNLVASNERPDWAFVEAIFGRFLKNASTRLLESTQTDSRKAQVDSQKEVGQ